MTVRPGFPAVSGAATFQDIRRALAGQVAKSAAGVLRTGILPIGTGPLMVGTASMVVNVQTCVVVLDRNGAVFLPNDGVQAVQLSSAPTSGSRWSVVYAKQRETEAPFSDSTAGPLFDKVESTTSETAARNQLPAGARELGVWKIDAGTTTTNAASGATYTETVPYTAMEGGAVLLRNQAEQDAWAPHDGSLAYRLDTAAFLFRYSGAWQVEGGPTPVLRTTIPAANGLPANSWVTLALDAPSKARSLSWSSSANSRITAGRSGAYLVAGAVVYQGSVRGEARLLVNGAALEAFRTVPDGNGYCSIRFAYDVELNAGDYVELQVSSNSGGQLLGGSVSARYIGGL